VAVEERETILSGLASMITVPLASETSTGKASGAVVVVVDAWVVAAVVPTVVVEVAGPAVVVGAPDSAPHATTTTRVRTSMILLI
jgi:hypothetical protein